MRAPEDQEATGGLEIWQERDAVCYQMLVKLPGMRGSQPAKRWLMVRFYENGEATLSEMVKPK